MIVVLQETVIVCTAVNHDGYHAVNYDSCHTDVHICSFFTTVRPFPSLNLITGSST